MKNKLILVFLVGSVVSFGQDSTVHGNQAKIVRIVDRFNQITGPDINCSDSLNLLQSRIEELTQLTKTLNDKNKLLTDAIEEYQQSLYRSERSFLVEKYGKNNSKTDYSTEQYNDFKHNYFLKSFGGVKEEISVFFPFNKSVIHLEMYQELDSLVLEYFNRGKGTFNIIAYSDSYGLEKYNRELSKERAEFIRDYLVNSKKVNPKDIKVAGKGSKAKERFQDADLDFLNRRAVITLS